MDITEVDAILERHRDKFRRLLQTIVAEEAGQDPFYYPLHRFNALSDDDRATLVRRAALIAADKVERELRSRGAAWLVLVGDDVVMASADPENEGSPRTTLVADLDTGSHATLIDADLAEMRASTWFTGRHLGEPFLWSIARMEIEVAQSSGPPLRRSMAVRVVRDWKSSPFTRIHSERKALVGRDFLRAFALQVILRAASARQK